MCPNDSLEGCSFVKVAARGARRASWMCTPKRRGKEGHGNDGNGSACGQCSESRPFPLRLAQGSSPCRVHSSIDESPPASPPRGQTLARKSELASPRSPRCVAGRASFHATNCARQAFVLHGGMHERCVVLRDEPRVLSCSGGNSSCAG
jgi:hypothetical protein